MQSFDMEHVVGFEETNVVGNVYFAHPIRWQGKCREMFLAEHAPDVLSELNRDLRLITLNCSCEYFDQMFAFDRILVRMTLQKLEQNRVVMAFDYVRDETVVARGEQAIACMREKDGALVPCAVPDSLQSALERYRG